jgi:hypothetical protein
MHLTEKVNYLIENSKISNNCRSSNLKTNLIRKILNAQIRS